MPAVAAPAIDPALAPADPEAAEDYRLSGLARKLLQAEARYDQLFDAKVKALVAAADASDELAEAKAELLTIRRRADAEGIPVKPVRTFGALYASSGDAGWEARAFLARFQRSLGGSW